MNDVLIGRQAIFDSRLEVQAYELLFRYGAAAPSAVSTPNAWTMQVLTNALTAFGLDRLVGSKPASVNVTREFLLSRQPLPVDPSRLLLEVPESVEPDAEMLTCLDDWRHRGFRIAIDGVTGDKRDRRALYECADMLKVDCLARRPDDLALDVGRLLTFKKPLVAKNLESRREVDQCVKLGFTYFQGHFLERPGIMRTRRVEESRASILRLLVELQDPDCDPLRIEALAREDGGLAFRLLRSVNSTACGLPRRIDSIGEAVRYLGLAHVRNMASLLLLTRTNDQPHELLRMTTFRARLCERLAQEARFSGSGRCFTVGLLSLFDSLLGEPMEVLLENLPVSTYVRAALLEHKGDAGRVLQAVIALEHADWSQALALGLNAHQIQDAWMSAVREADSLAPR
jgi:EAL and modified HD-GYP domain-containing signal transduction protein